MVLLIRFFLLRNDIVDFLRHFLSSMYSPSSAFPRLQWKHNQAVLKQVELAQAKQTLIEKGQKLQQAVSYFFYFEDCAFDTKQSAKFCTMKNKQGIMINWVFNK